MPGGPGRRGRRTRHVRRAASLLGACGRLLDDEGVPLERTDETDRSRHEAAARELLDAAAWDAASAEGWAMGRDEAVAYVLVAMDRSADCGANWPDVAG